MRIIDGDKLKEKVIKWMPSDPCGIEEREFPFETDIVASLFMEIDEAPSIEQPTWIPCSERQPEKAGHYLCSFKKPNFIDNIYVNLAYWTGGRWYGYSANAINAWMPLPEPWKGADNE